MPVSYGYPSGRGCDQQWTYPSALEVARDAVQIDGRNLEIKLRHREIRKVQKGKSEMTTVQRRKRKVQRTSRNGRADGFVELSWYKTFKFFITKANDGRGYDVVLTGGSSTGKTTAAYMAAHDLGYDIVVQQCHRRVEVEEFRGTRSIIPGKGGMPITGFDPGSLTYAVEKCSRPKVKGVIYLIDEINLVDPAMLAILNNLTQRDAHSCLVIPETHKSYPRPDNFIIIGTKNPEYAGTNALSEAFLSRVVLLECPMMEYTELRKIMLTKFPNNPDMAQVTTRMMRYVEAARLDEQHQWEPDLRTMFQFLDYWQQTEPHWKMGFGLNKMAEVFDTIIGPKIGWKDTAGPVRQGLVSAITTSFGKGLRDAEEGNTNVGMNLIDVDVSDPDSYVDPF